MNTRTLTSKLIAMLVAIGISFPVSLYASPEKAAEFYEQATQAYQDGDLRKAADLLERAFAQDNDLVYQYNRILALEGLKEFAESLRVLSIYEEPMTKDSQNRFSDVAEIKARLVAGKKQQEDLAKDQATKDQEAKDQAAKDQAAKDQEAKDKESKPAKESETNWGAISLISGGGVALVVGTLFGSGMFITGYEDAKCISEELADGAIDFEDAVFACEPEDILTESQYEAVIDTQGTHQIVAISMWTVGALAVGGGIWWLLSGDSSDRSATLAPVIMKNGAGAVFQFDF